MGYRLVIGNKNYSSWSLRAWLFLRESGIDFEEIRIPMFTDHWRTEVARHTPAGRVPVLLDGDLAVWDTTAIYEHVRERHPQAVGWPQDPRARALARSVAAEMHSGFLAIRGELPQNLKARCQRPLESISESARAQVARVKETWTTCRTRHGEGGPWLFGRFTLPDVVYAPVALRFVTYGIPVEGAAAGFVEAVRGLPSVQEWIRDAQQEGERLSFIDDLLPVEDTPIVPG